MEEIKISNGLIAIGFSYHTNSLEQTKFCLSLANKLAKNERVLYISWKYYQEKMKSLCKLLEIKKDKKLIIDTSTNYFGLESFFQIINLIETYNIETLIIDDISNFIRKQDIDNDLVLKTLKFISDRFLVRVLFNLKINNEAFLNNDYVYEHEPELGFFNWSRQIINDCNQVIAIKNLAGEVNDEVGELYNENIFKVYELKNKEDEVLEHIIEI